MTQIVGSWTTIVASGCEPAVDDGEGAGADYSNTLISYIPSGIELLRRHSQLAVAVEKNQLSLSLIDGTRMSDRPIATLRGLRSPSQMIASWSFWHDEISSYKCGSQPR